jgi:hypothetical protein
VMLTNSDRDPTLNVCGMAILCRPDTIVGARIASVIPAVGC